MRRPLDAESAKQLAVNWRKVPLDDEEKSILEFVEKDTFNENPTV